MPAATIHIIDDEASVRQALSRLLRAHDYAVDCYASVDDFLARQTAEPQHACVIADLRMPGKNGFDLLQALGAPDSRLPVIVITGHADRRVASEALAAGARHVLLKPFDDTTLLGAIRDALRQPVPSE